MRRGAFKRLIISKSMHSKDNKVVIRGFTMVEMIVTLAVIGFISVLTLPSLISKLAGSDLEGNAKEISSAMMVARVKAIETQMPHRVKFDLNSNPQKFIIQRGITSRGVTTWVDDVTIKEMNDNVMINKIDDVKGRGKSSGIGSIEFSPLGNPTRGVVYLEDNKGDKYTIALNVATGKVTKTKNELQSTQREEKVKI